MHLIYLTVLAIYAGYCIYGFNSSAALQANKGWVSFLMPSTVTWILQFIGIIFVYIKHWNPLHLIWWAVASTVVYTSLFRALWKMGIIDDPFK